MTASAPSALVVGTGFGCRIQVPALRAAGFDVVGLVGTNADRTSERARANGVVGAFTDLGEAIARTGAVAVAIATPPQTHAGLVLTAIEHGCHVICEKPFAANTNEAQAMLEAAQAAGIVHLVGHEFRWDPARAMLRRVVAEGMIGEPKLANFTSFLPYLIGSGTDMPDWWFDEDSGGGWLGAAGSHLIDWIRSLLGEFGSLSATLLTFDPGRGDADDTYAFRFRLASGVEGSVQQSAATWGPPLDIVRIAGTRGSVWLENGEIMLADREGTRIVDIPRELALPGLPAVSTDPRQQTAKWQMLTQLELPPYVRLCETFRALIEGRQPEHADTLPTFVDGLAAMRVLDAIRLSASRNGALISIGEA